MSYYLVAYPADAAWLPRRVDRERVKVGDLVKLELAAGEWDRERLWCRVVEVRPAPTHLPAWSLPYVGTLENVPLCTTELDHGARVRFGPEHVLDIVPA